MTQGRPRTILAPTLQMLNSGLRLPLKFRPVSGRTEEMSRLGVRVSQPSIARLDEWIRGS